MNERLLQRRNTKNKQSKIVKNDVYIKEWLGGKGAQKEMYERADKLGDTFYVSREHQIYPGTSTYSYNSFKDLDMFLIYQSTINEPKHFYELIRENKPCKEYYDIDAPKSDFKSINIFLQEFNKLREEFITTQQIITEFEPLLEKHQRNLYEYIAINRRLVPCQIVTESCSSNKFSLHIVYNHKRKFKNTTELKYFMNAFDHFLKSKNTKIKLDLSVYNKNSAMRTIGSSKISDTTRIFKSYHHIDLPMSNFFISNPTTALHNKLNMIHTEKKLITTGYPKLTDEEELEFCQILIRNHINKDRAKEYRTWFDMGCALYNVLNGSKEGLDLFLEFSQLCPEKYDEQTCIDVYRAFRDPDFPLDTKITKGSLIYWYNEDKSRIAYKRYKK